MMHRLPKTLFTVLLILFALAAAIPGSAAHAAEDIDPPIVESFDFTPKSVDVSNGPQEVVFTARITDASGVSVTAAGPHVLIWFTAEGWGTSFDAMSRISGTATDGMYQSTISISTSFLAGDCTVGIIDLADILGNRTVAYHTEKLTITKTTTVMAPVFSDLAGTAKDTYTVPATAVVEYVVGGVVKPAGTYQGAGTVMVSARALAGYVLSGTTTWSHTFDTRTPPVVYSLGYTRDLYVFEGGVARAISYAEWEAWGLPVPVAKSADYVRYPWSPTVYAVTFWSADESSWQWDRLSYEGWSRAGFPGVRFAGWIAGSYLWKWGTAPDIGIIGPDGVYHWLTYDEWAAMQFRTPNDRWNEGFAKLSWAPQIFRMTNLSAGVGYPIDYSQWQRENFPTPKVVQRFVGDEFRLYYGDRSIYYSGPGMNRAITGQEWAAAGYPTPTEVRGDDVDCDDFSSRWAAQDFFNNDGIACESYFG